MTEEIDDPIARLSAKIGALLNTREEALQTAEFYAGAAERQGAQIDMVLKVLQVYASDELLERRLASTNPKERSHAIFEGFARGQEAMQQIASIFAGVIETEVPETGWLISDARFEELKEKYRKDS